MTFLRRLYLFLFLVTSTIFGTYNAVGQNPTASGFVQHEVQVIWSDNNLSIIIKNVGVVNLEQLTFRLPSIDFAENDIKFKELSLELVYPISNIISPICFHFYIDGGSDAPRDCLSVEPEGFVSYERFGNVADAFWLTDCISAVCSARSNIGFYNYREDDSLVFKPDIICSLNSDCTFTYPFAVVDSVTRIPTYTETPTPSNTPILLVTTETNTPTEIIINSATPFTEPTSTATLAPVLPTPTPMVVSTPMPFTLTPSPAPVTIIPAPLPLEDPPSMICYRDITTLNPFCLDKQEVSYGAYDECVTATRCSQLDELTENNRDLPVTNISWIDARAYCFWRGEQIGLVAYQMRLPSEAQWLYAALGNSERIYPWGNERDIATPNVGLTGKPVSVNEENGDITPDGIQHLFGNVSEWTRTIKSTQTSDDQPNNFEDQRIILGNNWTMERNSNLVQDFGRAPYESFNVIGFRCAIDGDG